MENTHTGQHLITLNNINAEGITDGAEGTVLVSVNNEQGKFVAKPTEGTLYWNKYELGSKESGSDGYTTDWYLKTASQSEVIDPEPLKPSEPIYTTSVDTIMSTNALNYYTWRESDKLLQMMGELRLNGEEDKGVWFRVKGSEIENSGLFGFGNKYTTYQLGYDEVSKRTEKMTRYQGVALSYTDGSSSYKHGSGDNHAKALSLYNTEQRSKGHYLDLVLQVSDMDNDFKVHDTNGSRINGEFANRGISLSAEYGRKKDLGSSWYIEPQAQLTLGYLSGDDYTTSNGIKVEQSGIFSAVGRVGFNIGKQVGERGIIYAKDNLLHEFGGEYDVHMRDNSGRISKSDRFDDTWFVYGLGAALATGKQSHIYFDVEKSTGGDFSKNWQWNAGIRYNF